MHSIAGALDLQHPAYCDPGRCNRQGRTLHHRSVEAIWVPRQRDTTDASTIRVTVERLDEVDERTGTQVEHPDEAVLDYGGGRRERWGIEDVQDLAGMILNLAASGCRIAAVS